MNDQMYFPINRKKISLRISIKSIPVKLITVSLKIYTINSTHRNGVVCWRFLITNWMLSKTYLDVRIYHII